jgi:hypothetical protein
MCGLSPSDNLGLFAGDVDTLACALLERVYFCKVGDEFQEPPPVNGLLVRDRLRDIRNQLIRQTGAFAPVTHEEFIDMYKGPKRAVYERAVQSLAEISVNVQDAKAKAFVKREKCNVNKAPRVIQPRDPRYGASLGRYIKPFEKVLYKSMARLIDGDQIISKGLNLDGVGQLIHSKWDKFRRPCALGLDATKFDMHCSRQILEWEHSVYNGIFNSPELRKLLKWQLTNRGSGFTDNGKVKYVVEGRRLSGDMNTSSGNCLIMCSVVIAYCRKLNIKFDLINNGDDCVLFFDREDLQLVTEGISTWFHEFGYRIVCEDPVYDLEAIEFCQMHPVYIEGQYRMVRNPKTAIEKDSFCVTTLHQNLSFQNWAAGVATGGKAGCDGIPVMYNFYQFLGQNGKLDTRLLENSGMSRLQRGMSDLGREISQDTRYSFFKAFGIMPDVQEEIESWFKDARWSHAIEPYRYQGYLPL